VELRYRYVESILVYCDICEIPGNKAGIFLLLQMSCVTLYGCCLLTSETAEFVVLEAKMYTVTRTGLGKYYVGAVGRSKYCVRQLAVTSVSSLGLGLRASL